MSVKVSALCWRVRLPSTAKFVLIRLADYANDAGKRIFPAISTVADECGLSHRSVQNAFKALTDVGVLVLERASKGGRGHTSVYSLDLARLAELAVSGHGGPVSGQANGFDHGVNHAPPAGFDAPENHAPPAGFGGNHATGAQNHAPAAPEPSLPVKEEGSLCGTSESTPREAHTQGAPDSSEKKSAAGSNVVLFVPPSIPEAMPDGWVPPDEYRDWALAANWTDVDGAADRFRNHWLGKRDRGDRDAANTEAGWLRQWKGWINGNLKWERDHGKQRHDHQQRRGNGDLASYVKSHCAGWAADAAGGSNPW